MSAMVPPPHDPQRHVYSPEFDELFSVGTNQSVVNAQCPIDQTPLVNVSDYDDDFYFCNACKARYYSSTAEEVSKQAKTYALRKKQELENKKEEIAELERIISAAQKNKII